MRRARPLLSILLPAIGPALSVACAGSTPEAPRAIGASTHPPVLGAARERPVASVKLPAAAPAASMAAPTASSAPTRVESSPAAEEPLPLPEGTMVLHIGDSMAGALGIALNDELKRHKIRAMLRFKTASYIPNWAGGQELPLYLAMFKPDLVLITLGTNEVKMLDPTQRAPMIRKIVRRLEGRPCVWIAPPVWTKELGMYQVIRENIAPCRYMDTAEVYPDMPRLDDKVHPTYPARSEWARRVVGWLAKERRPKPDRPWDLAPTL